MNVVELLREGATFDCPRCDHESDHFNLAIALFRVVWHFYWWHPGYSFRVGSPFHDATPPEPEAFTSD